MYILLCLNVFYSIASFQKRYFKNAKQKPSLYFTGVNFLGGVAGLWK